MNIKYLFVVSMALFFIFSKNSFAQSGIDLDLMSIESYSDSDSDDDDLIPIPDETNEGDPAIVISNRTLQDRTPTRGIYTDDFTYRWYIQAGAGAQFLMGEDDSKGSFAGRLTLAPSITGGYRWNPIFGVRLNFSGGSLHGYNDGESGTYHFWKGKSNEQILALSETNGFPKITEKDLGAIRHWDPQWNYKGWSVVGKEIIRTSQIEGYKWTGFERQELYMQHLRYAAANAAVTMNLFNLFGGADDSRKFDATLYAGPTYFHVFPHQGVKAYNGFAVNGGVQAQYHINEKFGVFTEFSGSAMPDGFDGHLGGDTFDLIGQAVVGLTYKFPADKWSQPTVIRTVVENDDMNDEINKIRAEIMDEMNQMVDLQPEIDRLRAQLAALTVKPVIEEEIIEPKPEAFFLPDPVHFTIGKSDIDAAGWSVIEKVAAYLNNNPDATVIITGYADKDTGTDAINERLSRERSKNVADALTYRYNIPNGRVAIDWRGDSIQPFFRNQMNRAVLFYIDFE